MRVGKGMEVMENRYGSIWTQRMKYWTLKMDIECNMLDMGDIDRTCA